MSGYSETEQRYLRPSGASSRLSIELLTSPRDLEALEPHWRRLQAGGAPANIFLTWEWISAWRAQIAPRDDLRIVVVADGSGEPVGLAPFVVRRERLWRELVFMGCTVAAPDHLDCLAAPGWQQCVGAAVAAWLESPRGRREWDIVRLDGMRPDSALVQSLVTAVPRHLTAMWSIECPFIPLAPTWEEYRAGLSGNFRRNLDRRLRKLERESSGSVTFDTVTGESGLEEGMTELIELHHSVRSRHGQSGAFDSSARRRFYRDVVRRFANQGWLRIHRLKVDGKPVSMALCFAYRKKAMLYQMGYDLEWGRYGPGYLIGRYMIESAIRGGASEFDMLRGGHSYKYEWNAQTRSIVKLRLAASPAGGVVAPVTRWLRAAKCRWKGMREAH